MAAIEQCDYCQVRQEACDAKLEGVRRLLLSEVESHEKIVELYQKAINERIEGMNHLRDRLNSYLPAVEFRAEHKVLEMKMDVLAEWKARSEGEHSRTVFISLAAIIISVVATVINAIHIFGGVK